MKQILIVRASGRLPQEVKDSLAQVKYGMAKQAKCAVIFCFDSSVPYGEFKFSTLTPAAELSPEQMEKLKVLLESVTLPEEKQEEGERPLQ